MQCSLPLTNFQESLDLTDKRSAVSQSSPVWDIHCRYQIVDDNYNLVKSLQDNYCTNLDRYI
jgi:hypothetical protein